MGDPLSNLLWFMGLGAAVAAVVWPRHGVIAWLRRHRSAADRILVEDALKQAYHHEDRTHLGLGKDTHSIISQGQLDEVDGLLVGTATVELDQAGLRELATRLKGTHAHLAAVLLGRDGESVSTLTGRTLLAFRSTCPLAHRHELLSCQHVPGSDRADLRRLFLCRPTT